MLRERPVAGAVADLKEHEAADRRQRVDEIVGEAGPACDLAEGGLRGPCDRGRDVALGAMEVATQLGVRAGGDPELQRRGEDRPLMALPEGVEALLERRRFAEAGGVGGDPLLGQVTDRGGDDFGAAAEVRQLGAAGDTGQVGDPPGGGPRVAVGDEGLDRGVEEGGAGLGSALGLGARPPASGSCRRPT